MKEFCDQGWDLASGRNTGECCCNCENQIELFKHPWNKINKGKASESTKMFACILEHKIDDNNKGTLFETEHGYCECYYKKKFRRRKLKQILK